MKQCLLFTVNPENVKTFALCDSCSIELLSILPNSLFHVSQPNFHHFSVISHWISIVSPNEAKSNDWEYWIYIFFVVSSFAGSWKLVVGSWQLAEKQFEEKHRMGKYKLKWCAYYGSNLFDIYFLFRSLVVGAFVVWNEHKFCLGFIRVYLNFPEKCPFNAIPSSPLPSLHDELWTLHSLFAVYFFVRQTSITKSELNLYPNKMKHKRELNGNHDRRKIGNLNIHRWSLDVPWLVRNRLNKMKHWMYQTKEILKVEFEEKRYDINYHC